MASAATQDPATIFKKRIPNLADPLGKSTNFTRVTDFLFGEDLITSPQLEAITSKNGLTDNQRGSAVAHRLRENLENCGDNKKEAERRLLLICDIFEKREIADEVLKRIAGEMREKLKGSTPAPQPQPQQSSAATMLPSSGNNLMAASSEASSEAIFEKFTNQSARLSSAITPSLLTVVNKLRAKGLIGFELTDEFINGNDINSKKASKLVNELERKLRNDSNPGKFLKDLCDVLKSVGERNLTEIAQKLL